MTTNKPHPDTLPPEQVEQPAPTDDDVQAWEEIEAGRYMPRRIRGSFRGRALG